MKTEDKIKWCIDQHIKTNHWYDQYLPYEFHLRMVAQAAKDFIHLIPDSNDGENSFRDSVTMAAYGHDLIEDTRVSYNDVKEVLGIQAADIIYAVSNEKGKNRKERANDKYYEGIRNTPGAVFVKMCDRIANVQYSKMTGSRMFEMYKKENAEFTRSLGFIGGDSITVEYPGHEYYKMYKYLINLFEK
jgi:(p)ppGpp synthase/HD superfamily hydrolase